MITLQKLLSWSASKAAPPTVEVTGSQSEVEPLASTPTDSIDLSAKMAQVNREREKLEREQAQLDERLASFARRTDKLFHLREAVAQARRSGEAPVVPAVPSASEPGSAGTSSAYPTLAADERSLDNEISRLQSERNAVVRQRKDLAQRGRQLTPALKRQRRILNRMVKLHDLSASYWGA